MSSGSSPATAATPTPRSGRCWICYFPWCNLPAIRADLDHIVPFDDTGPPGQTNTDNLGPGCRLHHRLKTLGGWTCTRLPDGAIEWTTRPDALPDEVLPDDGTLGDAAA